MVVLWFREAVVLVVVVLVWPWLPEVHLVSALGVGRGVALA